MPLTNEQIKVIMMRHGFTIKEGMDDLKHYVYAAARAIEQAAIDEAVTVRDSLAVQNAKDAAIAAQKGGEV